MIELSEDNVPIAMGAGLPMMAAILEAFRAHAYLNRPIGNRQDNIDKAVAGFGRALTMTIVPEEAARLHMHIGIAMAERLRGDPADNLEAALNAMREGLRILRAEASSDLRATLQTNIATTLLDASEGRKLPT